MQNFRENIWIAHQTLVKQPPGRFVTLHAGHAVRFRQVLSISYQFHQLQKINKYNWKTYLFISNNAVEMSTLAASKNNPSFGKWSFY